MRLASPILLLSLIAAPALAVEVVAPRQAPAPLTRAVAKVRIAKMFAETDPNRDGVVTRAEYDARIRKMLAERPVGSPGGPTAAQVQQIRAAAGQSFTRTDLNHDGKLDAAEAGAGPLAMFDRADVNHDGVLSTQEQMAGIRAMQQARGAQGG